MKTQRDPLRLVLFGDIFLGGDLTHLWYTPDYDPFKALHSMIRNDDLIYANIESTFFRGPLRPRRSNHLWSPPESVRALNTLGLDVAGYANNHSFDFGTKAMMRSINLLEKNDIACIGAGLTVDKASEGHIIERNGWKVGFKAYTTNAYHVRSIVASNFSVGCAPMNKKRMKSDLEKLRLETDVICVALHWGYEFLHIPHPKQRVLASQLIEWGADVIIGTHPHVVQGYEKINNRPVFYSLGSLILPEYENTNGIHDSRTNIDNQAIVGIVEIINDTDDHRFIQSHIPIKFNYPYVSSMSELEKIDFEKNLSIWIKALTEEFDAGSNFIETMAEIKARDRQWPIRIWNHLKGIIVNLLTTLIGTCRMDSIRYRLRRMKL
jgi:poly-gamma-glutamate capsule biosynthesis protein CapA/YwtB (metallophosphatase superfamily)